MNCGFFNYTSSYDTRECFAQIKFTTDNSSYGEAGSAGNKAWAVPTRQGDTYNTFASGGVNYLFDVTNTTNDKFKIAIKASTGAADSATRVHAGSLHVMVYKIADT